MADIYTSPSGRQAVEALYRRVLARWPVAFEQLVVSTCQGDTFVVPKGTEHKPSSPGGSILMFEPSGTSTTGDRHEGPIPDHVDRTTGHELDQRS